MQLLLDICQALLYIDERDGYEQTALMFASCLSHPKQVQWLVEEGSDVDLQDSIGQASICDASDLSGPLEKIPSFFLKYIG